MLEVQPLSEINQQGDRSTTENSILSSLAYDPESGALSFNEVRYMLIRPETLASLQASLESRVGPETAAEIFYAGGFTGGQLSGRKYRETFGLSEREAVEFMCRMGGEIGWGHFRLLDLDVDDQRLTVEVEFSPIALTFLDQAVRAENGDSHDTTVAQHTSGNSVCHLTRGVLGGLGSGIFETPVEAVETLCRAKGDPVCRFEIVGVPS